MTEDIVYLTERALWETENLIKCIPDELWEKRYDDIPMWKYVYHMLFSLDRWYINPDDAHYHEPSFHTKYLANLNVVPEDNECISRKQIDDYFQTVKKKIIRYTKRLSDNLLNEKPEGCNMTRFRLILGQFRHWHRHMGIIYGFIVEDCRKWPYVLNMLGEYPENPMPNYYDDVDVKP